jgi:hypothetical protein
MVYLAAITCPGPGKRPAIDHALFDATVVSHVSSDSPSVRTLESLSVAQWPTQAGFAGAGEYTLQSQSR